MNESVVRNGILRHLYEAYFGPEMVSDLNKLCQEENWEHSRFWKIVDRIAEQGLIAMDALGGYYRITMMGIVRSEQLGLASQDLQFKNSLIRAVVLEELTRAYEEAESSYADVALATFVKKTGMDSHLVLMNLQWLEDCGHVQYIAAQQFRMTEQGLFLAQQHRRHAELVNEYDRISGLNAQARGRALQKLLASVFEENGWSQEEGVRTSKEEIDVIIHRDREDYITECKWEQDPVEAPVVRELGGKLDNRVGVRGMIISISGFTRGAIKQAEDFASRKIVLFFGPNDVRSLVYQASTFDELLNSKYQQLITRRQIVAD